MDGKWRINFRRLSFAVSSFDSSKHKYQKKQYSDAGANRSEDPKWHRKHSQRAIYTDEDFSSNQVSKW